MSANRGELAQAVRDYLVTRRKTAFTSEMAMRALPQFPSTSVRTHLQRLAARGLLISSPTPGERYHTYQEVSFNRLGRRSGRMVMTDELILAVMSLPARSIDTTQERR